MPTRPQALQFALMIKSGMPALEVLAYFYPDFSPTELNLTLTQWLRSSEVQAATLTVQGKAWQEMRPEEQIEFAINKTYAEMAYFLYSHNYCTLVGGDKQKADTCRSTLEAKLAGTSGKLDPISVWWADIKSGKVKLPGLAA